MIVDLHDNDGRDVLLDPGVVTEGFPETVTGDMTDDADGGDGLLDDTPSLDPADRGFLAPTIGEDMLAVMMGMIEAKGLDDLLVEGDGLRLPRLMLGDGDMGSELIPFLVVNLAPAELQEVADPERGTGCHDDHGIVTILAFKQEVVG